MMDSRGEERVVQRTSSKEKRSASESATHSAEKGSAGLHNDLYFDQDNEYKGDGDDEYVHWKGQRRGGSHRYRSRWPSGRRIGRSYGRSQGASRATRRSEDLDEGEIFEVGADVLDENEVLEEWVVEGTEFANDGSLIVEEYVLDDESLQAGLQRYNNKYLRGRGGFRRPSSSRARKSYERQRPYEKYEIIDEKTFGNYASRSRARSPQYRESENYREVFEAEEKPQTSREWSKRTWSRGDNPSYHKQSISPEGPRGADERYGEPEREESGKQFYDPRYLSAKSVEGEGSPVSRRKAVADRSREEGSPTEHRSQKTSNEKGEYDTVSPQGRRHNWAREQSPSGQPQERSWSRSRRDLSPPAAYKLRSQSPPDKRRAYSPTQSDKRDRGKDGLSPKKRDRSDSPHTRGQRGGTVSSGKGGHSVSPAGRKSGKSSRKRERSPPASRKRGRSSSSSSSDGDRSGSQSDSRDSQDRATDRESSSYSARAGGHSRDPRRSGASSAGHASQHGQDASWKQPADAAHEYAAMQQQQFGIESGGIGSAGATAAVYPGTYTSYGAQPDISAYHQAGHAGYDLYNYQAYYQQSAMQSSYGGEFPPHQVPPNWSEAGVVLPDMTQPPPLQLQMQGAMGTDPESKAEYKKSEEARKEAIKKEQKEQKLTLIKQREEYFKKSGVLCEELELLREQKEELLAEKSCDNDRILKENGKLQLEIQNKLKAINNVIDMLTGIIGDKKDKKEEKKKSQKEDSKGDKHKTSGSSKIKVPLDEYYEEDNDNPVYNYVYYDPEVHWCRVCDVFPRTAKEYLHHLHCAEHKELTAKKKMVDMPWHKNKPEPEVPHYKGAPTKRTSIKGLQFLISVSSWYCKLCDTWIGDLHCVSLHLKSKLHLENYKEFTDKNPKWELEWLTEREQAFQRKNEEKLLMQEGSRKDDSPLDFGSKIKEENDSDVELPPREIKPLAKAVGKEKTKVAVGTWAEVVAAPPRTTRIPTTTALGGVAHRSKPRTIVDEDDSSESEEGEVKTGRSIRVSMRNKPKMSMTIEQNRGGWTPVEREVREMVKVKGEVGDSDEEGDLIKSSSSRRDEKSFQEWLPKAPATISDDDRQLLSNIKDRLKQKQEAEKERDEEKEKEEEKEKKVEREKFEQKGGYEEKSKPEHDRGYDRGRSWDRDRSAEKEWYRERDRRDRSRERKRNRSKRYGSISPRRRSPDRRNRYDKKYDSYKDRRRDRGDYRSDSRGERDVREDKVYQSKPPEEMEKKFDPFCSKKEKKQEPKPPRPPKKLPDPNCPKTKLPFIGRMPLLKHIAKKKGPESGMKGEDGKDDGDGGANSPSNEGKESEDVGKIEGVQDMDIDDDNSDGELPDSQEREDSFMEEKMDSSKDGMKIDTSSLGPPGNEPSSQMPSTADGSSTSGTGAPATTKVSRFGPLMEMSSGPILITSFDQPTGVQVQLCAPARLAAVPPVGVLAPPGTVAEGTTSTADGGEAKPKKVVDEIPLPKDFQDALNILFPEKSAMGDHNAIAPPGVTTPPGTMESGEQDVCADSQGMMQHVGMPMPHGMPHGMHPMDPSAHHHMYSGPPPMHLPPPMLMGRAPPSGVLMGGPMMGPMDQQMAGAMEQQMAAGMDPHMAASMEQQMSTMVQDGDESMTMSMSEQMAVPEEPVGMVESVPEKAPRKKYMEMGDDELAMLGIDPEDMAAQTFAPKRPYS